MPIIGGVPCTIYWGEDGQQYGVKESWPEGGPHTTIYWACPWGFRAAVKQALRGGLIGPGYSFVRPHQNPYDSTMFCSSIGECINFVARADQATGLAYWDYVVIPAEYTVSLVDFAATNSAANFVDPSGKPFTITSARASAEIMAVPTGTYFWEGGSLIHKPLQQGYLGILRPRIEFRLKFPWLTKMPVDFMLQYGGTINQPAISFGNHLFPSGTVLFPTSSSDPGRCGTWGKSFETEMVLIASGPVEDPANPGTTFVPTWNHIFAPDGSWQFVNSKADGSGVRPYRAASWWTALPVG